jgi:HK97 family phage major capsid protein
MSMSQAAGLAQKAIQMLDRIEAEGRQPTAAESREVENLIQRAKATGQFELVGRELGAPSYSAGSDPNVTFGYGSSPGELFVKSEQYLRIKDSAGRGERWSTGPIKVSDVPLSAKGTLLEAGVGGPGGGLTPPGYEAGVVSKLFEPLGVADLFGTSQTTASQVRYVVEGTALSPGSSMAVAEGGTKPESTIAMSEVVEPIKKIATVLPVSDELLEDAPSIQAYLNTRLTLFVKLEEERQLLRGAGTNELVGIFGRSGINQYTKLATDDNAVALAKVIANTAGSAFLAPDTIVMHPTNWLNTRLLRDGTGGTIGQFYGGGPFGGAYGNGGAAGMFGQELWNTRVVLSNYVGPGTALVGNFGQAAHVWRRGGVTVEASNSHSNIFVLNLNMLRSEERLGLGVYRPVAFTEVRGLA